MSRVITFSRQFPAYHPKAGRSTYFVEKIWKGLEIAHPREQPQMRGRIDRGRLETCMPKLHTIRAGHRWEAGDWFSPRVWSGKPYQSPQIIIAPDMQVKKVWDFDMKPAAFIDECQFFLNKKPVGADALRKIAEHDGLSPSDFSAWFAGPGMVSTKRKPFSGQIICWDENINY